MQQVLDKQTNSLNRLVELSKQDRLLQLIQTKESLDNDKENKDTIEQLKKLNENVEDLKKVTNDKNKGGVNSNVIKLFSEIKKSADLTKRPITSAEAKGITSDVMGRRHYKTFGERVTGVKENVKDFFTMRGFLDKTGIVKRGTGGMFSDALDRREAKQQYVQSRLKMDPTARLHGTEKASQIFAKQFDEQQRVERDIRVNESKLSKYKKQGFTEEQIKRSEEFKKREVLATEMAKVDPRVRPEGFDPKTGKVKVKPESATKQADVAKKSVIQADTDTVTRKAKAEPKTAKVQKATSGASASSSILSAVSNVIPFPGASTKEDKPSIAAALGNEEATLEQNKKVDEQTELLKKIEENTRGGAGPAKPQKAEEDSGGGLLSGIMDFLGKGIMSAFKFLFNPKNLLKVFTKFLAPALIIGSLVNGIMDGFKAFAETGSIGEALIAGLGGVLSFLTFGLFDAETIRGVVDAVSGFVDDYIIQPITSFFNFLGDAFDTYIAKPITEAFETVSGLFNEYIIEPLKTVFEPVTKFFSDLKDTVVGWFENFEIPGINFTVLGKQFGFGPWHPFKSEASATPAPAAQSATPAPAAGGNDSAKVAAANQPQSGDAVSKQSESNKEANREADKGTGSGGGNIISAPTINNTQNTTAQTIKLQPRNRDNSVTGYLSSRYA